MDHANPIESPITYRLHRAEYVVAFAVVTGLIIAHFGEIRWLPAIALFVYIDIVGYIPGAIAFHRSKDGRISKNYYVAYNVMHSLITQGAVAGLWMWLVKPEWALLALPFHLFGDRGLFGNFLKPFGLPFEPQQTAAYRRFARELAAERQVTEPGRLVGATGAGQ
jgi:hypothetical protein